MLRDLFMKDTTFRVFYHSANFTTGLTDVRITIKKADGTTVVDDALMMELEEGLYFLDFTPTEIIDYLATANSSSLPAPASKLFHVNPNLPNLVWNPTNTHRVFYRAKNDLSGLVDVKIIAWFGATRVINNLVMTESSTPGVYFYDVPLANPGSYVFKVDSASNPFPDMKSAFFTELELDKQFIFTSIEGTARSSANITAEVD